MPGPTVLFIIGPTASGKTAAALEIAARTPIEIVNADSRQVYRGMSIGTAKPTEQEQAAAPHHLIDVAAPDEPFSLARFLELARAAIADTAARGRTPVIVGGTGQYVWGLAEGWQTPAVPPDAAMRRDLEEEARRHGPEALHDRLRAVDPAAADAIDARNVRRVVRAIEVWSVTGAQFSEQRRRAAPGFTPRLLGIERPREALHRRIDERVDAMIERGWVEEVRRLLDSGYGPELPSFSSAGYRELAAHLRGESTLEEARERAKASARRLARAQGTWFKQADERIGWHPAPEALAEAALPLILA